MQLESMSRFQVSISVKIYRSLIHVADADTCLSLHLHSSLTPLPHLLVHRPDTVNYDRAAVTKVLTHSLMSSEHKASWPGQLAARQLVVKDGEVDCALSADSNGCLT